MGRNDNLKDKYINALFVKFHLSQLKAEGLKNSINTNSLWLKRVNQAMDNILQEADTINNIVDNNTHAIIEKGFLLHLVRIINWDDTTEHTIDSLYKAYIKKK